MPEGASSGPAEVLIECRGVACGYGGVPVLAEIDLAIRRGEVLALLGGSGSGKTTLLRTVAGLLPPLTGTVRLLGEELYLLEEGARARLLRQTGMLFQQGALFGSLSVEDNVALPLREHTTLPEPVIREIVRLKLALVGLQGFEGRLPSDLSGGQRKRVALVRASILDPEIILCDEPSSGLDPVMAATVDDTLLQFRRLFGYTIVVVTHELESIRRLNGRVVMLGDGRILATGTVAELSRSTLPPVHAFFHRIPPALGAAGQTVLERVEEG
jgi:phospholipid/cholesterol/gamma-HCH transport system ATP-binding protein